MTRRVVSWLAFFAFLFVAYMYGRFKQAQIDEERFRQNHEMTEEISEEEVEELEELFSALFTPESGGVEPFYSGMQEDDESEE